MNEEIKAPVEFINCSDGSVLEINHDEMEKITFFCDECREHTYHLIVNNVDSDPVRVCLVCNDVQPDIGFEEQDIAQANANAGSWLDDI